jgi:hypothetical protein
MSDNCADRGSDDAISNLIDRPIRQCIPDFGLRIIPSGHGRRAGVKGEVKSLADMPIKVAEQGNPVWSKCAAANFATFIRYRLFHTKLRRDCATLEGKES